MPCDHRTPAPRLLLTALPLALGLALTSCSASPPDQPAPQPSASTTATSATVSPADAAVASASDAVRTFYAVTDRVLSDRQVPLDEAAIVATGDALDAFRRQAQEQRVRGERQTGSVIVVSSTATSADLQAPATVDLDVCTDVSGVDVLDAAGASVLTSDRPTRSLIHIAVVNVEGSTWLVQRVDARGEACAG